MNDATHSQSHDDLAALEGLPRPSSLVSLSRVSPPLANERTNDDQCRALTVAFHIPTHRHSSSPARSIARSTRMADGESREAHYYGLFLDEKSERAIWDLVRELVGLGREPPGCKRSGDHVTIRYKPPREMVEGCRRRGLSGSKVSVRATHACVREKVFALAVSWEEVAREAPTPEARAAHVSVFAPTETEWRTLGDVVAEDLLNGNALDLSFVGGGLTLEGRLGVMMTDGSVDYGDEDSSRRDGGGDGERRTREIAGAEGTIGDSVGREGVTPRATTTRPEEMSTSKQKVGKARERRGESPPDADGDAEAAKRREEKKRDQIRRDYLELCEIFEVHHPVHVKTMFMKHGFDMEATAQDLLTQMTPEPEDEMDELVEFDDADGNFTFEDYDYDDYYDEDEGEEYEESGSGSGARSPDSTSVSSPPKLSKKLRKAIKRSKRRVRSEIIDGSKKEIIASIVGSSTTTAKNWGVHSEERTSKFHRSKFSSATIREAAGKWSKFQGSDSRTIRLTKSSRSGSNDSIVAAKLEQISEDLTRLRVQRDSGENARAASKIREKTALRSALENMGTEKKIKDMPAWYKEAHDLDFNKVLDFHGCDRVQAIHLLEDALVKISPMVTSDWKLRLITGRGNHSRGGRVIHGDVMRWLTHFGIAFVEGEGDIIVCACGSINS